MRIDVETNHFATLTGWHIRSALKWIDNDDRQGLGVIRVTEHCPFDREANNLEPYLRGFLYNGSYIRKRKDVPAEIVLYRADIHFGIPTILLTTPIATLKVARTLAHEVGHHVMSKRRHGKHKKYKPLSTGADRDAEETADAYTYRVISKMLRNPHYKLWNKIGRLLSTILFKAGIQDYWDGNYQSSARLLFQSFTLNLSNEEAGQAYRHAMEKLRTQVPSPLTTDEEQWLSTYYNPYPESTGKIKRSKRDLAI